MLKENHMKKAFALILILIIAFFAGNRLTKNKQSSHTVREDPLYAQFLLLASSGNSSCSLDFKDSIMTMENDERLQGSCCSPMSWHRYEEQVN
ncbi:hypothetical protein HY469_00360 [Candidatus Roizmanbacteria bacterium]|nr:hypothetical protein [Candidatus Roizmanbacteria bacterium]